MLDKNTIALLQQLSNRFETPDFIKGDPSFFMHQTKDVVNQETIAFVASALSYGNREQFMKKIRILMNLSEGDMYNYVLHDGYKKDFKPNDTTSFYRLYSHALMYDFFRVYQSLLKRHSSLKNYINTKNVNTISAIQHIIDYFSQQGICTIIPKNTSSACKRLCMFMRWMVRDNSPVDIGIWKNVIDKRTLIIPLDTHVLSQAYQLGLIDSKTASMSNAIKLTSTLSEVFPDDPLKGDFALFGYGISKK